MILEVDGDGIALLEPEPTEQLRRAVGISDHLSVADRSATVGHDQRCALRMNCGMGARVKHSGSVDTGFPLHGPMVGGAPIDMQPYDIPRSVSIAAGSGRRWREPNHPNQLDTHRGSASLRLFAGCTCEADSFADKLLTRGRS